MSEYENKSLEKQSSRLDSHDPVTETFRYNQISGQEYKDFISELTDFEIGDVEGDHIDLYVQMEYSSEPMDQEGIADIYVDGEKVVEAKQVNKLDIKRAARMYLEPDQLGSEEQANTGEEKFWNYGGSHH
jgi:hypothetical protein